MIPDILTSPVEHTCPRPGQAPVGLHTLGSRKERRRPRVSTTLVSSRRLAQNLRRKRFPFCRTCSQGVRLPSLRALGRDPRPRQRSRHVKGPSPLERARRDFDIVVASWRTATRNRSTRSEVSPGTRSFTRSTPIYAVPSPKFIGRPATEGPFRVLPRGVDQTGRCWRIIGPVTFMLGPHVSLLQGVSRAERQAILRCRVLARSLLE